MAAASALLVARIATSGDGLAYRSQQTLDRLKAENDAVLDDFGVSRIAKGVTP